MSAMPRGASVLVMVCLSLAAVACSPSSPSSRSARPGSELVAEQTPAKIVAGEGWGPVRRGVGQSQVGAALGAPDNVTEYDDCVFHDYLSRGIQINYFKANMHVDAIFFYNNQSDMPDFDTFDGETDKGITWSSTEDDVLAAYGNPVNDYKNSDNGIEARRMAYSAISFRFQDARLVCIAVGAD